MKGGFMSIKGWKYGLVSALSLLALTAHADPPDTAQGKQGRKAAGPAAPAAPAAAPADGEHGEHGQQAKQPAAAAGARQAVKEHAPDARHEEGHPPTGAGRPGDPPRAAIDALMRAQSLSEEQAIAHLRAQGAPPDVAVHDAKRGERDHVRLDRAKQLRGRLRARGIPNPVRVELRTHARRLAQIERIRTLVNTDTKMTARVDAMLVRENERHTRRLTRLIDEANQAPAGAVPDDASPAGVVPGAPPAVPGAAPPAHPAPQANKPAKQGVTP